MKRRHLFRTELKYDFGNRRFYISVLALCAVLLIVALPYRNHLIAFGGSTEGKAWFTGDPSRAALKVSFFGPFYGGYNVIAIDREYRHALVCGPDRDYLWILSRTPTLSEEMKQQMLAVATREGFDVSKLIWVKQPGA